MKKFAICLAFMLLLVGIANAQKSVTGTVIDYNTDYKTITVRIGKSLKVSNVSPDGIRSVIVFTVASEGCRTNACKSSAKFPAPKIVGNVKGNGRKVRIYYTQIISEAGFGYILRGVTKIVEVK